MNLCFSSHVLLAGLFLSVSALTPEECQPMVTPQSLDDLSGVYGRLNNLVTIYDNEAMNEVLKVTESSWMRFSASADSTNKIEILEVNKMNGNCLKSYVNMTVDGNTMKMILTNWTSVFHLLPSSEGCIVFSATTIANNLDNFLRLLGINMSVGSGEIHARSAHLMCREETLKDSDLEHFKQQASCLGFSGEPSFQYDPEKGFCKEDESFAVHF